jgi:branched-chain amino acid aminotransferase
MSRLDAAPPGPAEPVLWVDGREVDPRGPHLSALDRGFTLADGLFETMRVYDGVVFRLDRHLARLAHGARRLDLTLPTGLEAQLAAALSAAVARGRADASLRITVSRGVGAPGLAPPTGGAGAAGAAVTLVIAVHPLPRFAPSLYSSGLSAILASGRRNERAMTAGLKTLAYVDAIAALAEAQAAGADEALFLDTEGHLSEATASNLFAVLDGVLLTPPLSCAALPGITRAAVLELAEEHGIEHGEHVLNPGDLHAASEAFLTSSVREVVPLVRIGARPIGDGDRGPVTRSVIDAYAALVRGECARLAAR